MVCLLHREFPSHILDSAGNRIFVVVVGVEDTAGGIDEVFVNTALLGVLVPSGDVHQSVRRRYHAVAVDGAVVVLHNPHTSHLFVL